MKSCVFLNCRTLVILKGVCLSLYSFTHLLTQANVPVRIEKHESKGFLLSANYAGNVQARGCQSKSHNDRFRKDLRSE